MYNEQWKQAETALSYMEVIKHGENHPVTIKGESEDLQCIGIGTDAAVFVYEPMPAYAYKLYATQALPKKEAEIGVYRALVGSPYYPMFYGAGERYVVISYERGLTLYDCLLLGVSVPKQVIDDVEEARSFVREKGLNPRDIHLKNVLLQDGRGKVLDVSEYIQIGNDKRWEHLVWAYDNVYPLLEGRKLPLWMLEAVRNGYYRLDPSSVNLQEFADRISRLFFRR
ncbi:serine/threonine protein kinase [Paenibacillus sp. IHBB 10380]|uniref:serine/threonine protein kinase n=1 Tax=Paenibacillus sp. IHBB 10380 TaxID=1566358 RepID=UPI0005CFED48|nr:serine/threonine protein kinase [Paenibacillus sp. IHBB 10380]AJS58475.1 serine/threonine protein kinase [Paenibacillus sp. IHBB 10380]